MPKDIILLFLLLAGCSKKINTQIPPNSNGLYSYYITLTHDHGSEYSENHTGDIKKGDHFNIEGNPVWASIDSVLQLTPCEKCQLALYGWKVQLSFVQIDHYRSFR